MKKRKTPNRVRSSEIVSLRRYLEKSAIPLQAMLDNWTGNKRWKRYWLKAMAELKQHTNTVERLEREAQANDKLSHGPAHKQKL